MKLGADRPGKTGRHVHKGSGTSCSYWFSTLMAACSNYPNYHKHITPFRTIYFINKTKVQMSGGHGLACILWIQHVCYLMSCQGHRRTGNLQTNTDMSENSCHMPQHCLLYACGSTVWPSASKILMYGTEYEACKAGRQLITASCVLSHTHSYICI